MREAQFLSKNTKKNEKITLCRGGGGRPSTRGSFFIVLTLPRGV